MVGHLRNHQIQHSAETGTGKTTLIFSHLSPDHTVFTLGPESDSLPKTRSHPLLNQATTTFIEGPTQLTLPQHTFKYPLDFVLLDGPHGFPFPQLEYYYLYPHLRPGAILMVDDIHIRTIYDLFLFLNEDAMFNLTEVVANTAFFHRTDAPTFPSLGDNWWEQGYNANHFLVVEVRRLSSHPSSRLMEIAQGARPFVPIQLRAPLKRLFGPWVSKKS